MHGAFSALRAGGRRKCTIKQYKHNQACSNSEGNFSKHFLLLRFFSEEKIRTILSLRGDRFHHIDYFLQQLMTLPAHRKANSDQKGLKSIAASEKGHGVRTATFKICSRVVCCFHATTVTISHGSHSCFFLLFKPITKFMTCAL